jgi:hypothetical protein
MLSHQVTRLEAAAMALVVEVPFPRVAGGSTSVLMPEGVK